MTAALSMGMVELLTLREAAQRLKITPEQVAALVHDGEISYVNVGRGRKRPRMRFTHQDIHGFIERRTRRDVPCPSTSLKNPPITASTSGSEVIGFMARRNARHGAKPKP
jgi:excisionase family DNA binding protein